MSAVMESCIWYNESQYVPADSGPTTNRPFLKNNREPPPAATVFISSCGDCIVTPAVVVSKTCSYRPEPYLDTSVEVPPISNPITGVFVFGSYEVRAYPTTPPAGPERIPLKPENLPTSPRPPSLCMNSHRAPLEPLSFLTLSV